MVLKFYPIHFFAHGTESDENWRQFSIQKVSFVFQFSLSIPQGKLRRYILRKNTDILVAIN